ncbi:MAG: hypothetical protein KDB90_15730 [Planctomycetes bacterium]|nr:hypothetical protein [Planctomycetota bacterium]
MKYFVLLAACAVASALSAQVTYYTGTAGGYAVNEYDVTPLAPPQFGVPGGVAWDPSGSDVYYFDQDSAAIRRFDTNTNTPAATALYLVPNPGFLAYVDDMEFDEAVTTDLYFVESGGPYIYKLRRSGVDALDTSFGTGGVQTSSILGVYPYDLEFDPFSRLFVSGSNIGTSCGVWIVDQATLAVTPVVDLLTSAGSNSSGPVVFDAAGNMYCLLPPTFGSPTPMRVVRFSKALVDAAVASAGTSPLTVADGTMIIDGTANFPNGGRAALHTEFGKNILYFTANDGSVLRSDLATGAFTVFAQAAPPSGTDTNAPAAIAFQSGGDFRPFSGDNNQLCTFMYSTDTNFTVTGSSICFFNTTSAPASVNSLEITDAPTSVSNGSSFRFEIELRDASNALVTGDDGGVSVQVLSGSGTLGGTTFHASTYGAAVFDDLQLNGANGSVILRFSLVGSGVVVDSQVVTVTGGSGGSSGSKNDGSSGCTTGAGSGWLALLGLLATALVAARLRRVRSL